MHTYNPNPREVECPLVLLGVPDQWKIRFQRKVARNWQHQRLFFVLCWWVCTHTPPKPQTNYPEPDHVLFLQLKTVAKELVFVVRVRQILKGQRGGWSFRVGTKRGIPVFSAWRWSQGVALWNDWLTLFIQLSLWVQGAYHIPRPGDNISRVPPGLFVRAWKEAWGLRNGRQKRQRYKRKDRAAG